MFIALLRIVIPLVIVLIVLRIVWPRLQRSRQKTQERIEVKAKVVKSEQHRPPNAKE